MRYQRTATALRMRIAGILGFLVLIMILAACSGGFSETIEVRDESFPVGAFPRLTVENRNGSITIRSNSEGIIKVHATLHEPQKLDYLAESEGDTIRVTAKPKGAGIFNFGKGPQASLVIEVPSNTVVVSRSSNGRIEITGVNGSSVVQTSNGAIELRDVGGEIRASTSNGRITVVDSAGVFDLKSSNGAISFDGELYQGGDNRLETSNGSIDANLRGAPSVRIDASTSNGGIVSRLQLNTSRVEKNRLIGTVGDGDANLHIETSNGSINIR